jgi:hypothetical protein
MTRHLRTPVVATILPIFVIASLAASGLFDAANQAAGQTGGQAQRPATPPGSVPPEKAGPFTPSVIGWKDLETWTRDVGVGADTELGLGLQLSSPEGTMATSFTVVRSKRSPTAVPREVTVTLIPVFEPNRVRWSGATFRVTAKDKRRTTINASSRVTTYPPGPFGPGDGPVNAKVTLTPAEFAQIATADVVTGTLLNVTVNLRRDQLNALGAFGERAGLVRR